MRKFMVVALLTVVSAALLSGCGVHLMPSASATVLTPNINKGSVKVVPVGSVVSEEDCYTSAAFYLVGFGDHAKSHERLITEILEKYKADVIVDADLSYTEFHIPLIYQSHCAKVKGQPARLVAEGEVKK
jgi:hypothetical protein